MVQHRSQTSPRLLILLAGLLVLLGACQPVLPAAPDPTAASGAWYRLYFTAPGKTGPSNPPDGPVAALVAAVEGAQEQIDLAAYSLSLEPLEKALTAAKARGVTVRLVMESDSLDGAVPRALRRAGIPILGDRREGLMHDKFAVIDGRQVWTGSLNFTTSGAGEDNNHLIAVDSPELAEDYTAEFEEMFTQDQFGPGSPANTPHPALVFGSARLEVYFAPEDQAQRRLVDLIGSAAESLDFMVYSFTADPLAKAVLERAAAGVRVRGVIDARQAETNQGSEYERFREAGLDVRLDGNAGQMHHKVLIVDGKTVAFGSYNFSQSAERSNDENLLIAADPGLAGEFLEEFERVFAQAGA